MAGNDPHAIEIAFSGKRYELRLKDFTALDDLAIHQVCGRHLTNIYLEGDITLFTIAALLWRWRVTHNGEAHLSYEDVAAGFTFETLDVEDLTAPEA